MRGSRFLAVLTAAMLFVYSGCGGTGKKDSSSADSDGRATSSRQTTSANGEVLDVLSVPPEYFAAIVINLSRIARSPLLAELMKDDEVAEAIKKFSIHPDEIEQIIVPVRFDEKQPGQPKLSGYMITRFAHEVDAREVLARLHPRELIQDVQFGGKTCLDLGPGAGMAFVPARNTILLALKENMGGILAVTTSNSPLSERLKKAGADVDLVIIGEFETHPGLNKQIDACKADVPPFLQDYVELAKSSREFAVALDLRGDTLLQIVLDGKDAAAASAADERFKDAKKMLGGLLAGIKQGAPKEVRTEYADAFKLGDEAIDSVRVGKSGAQVTVAMKRPAGFDKAGLLIEKAVRAYFTVSRQSSRPQPPQDRPMPARPGKTE